MPFLDFFLWLSQTAAGRWVGGSTAAFATVESLHIAGFALLGGAVLARNLGALGLVLRDIDPSRVRRGLRVLFATGLALAIISGALLIASSPYKYATNALFPLKLGLLTAALVLELGLTRLAALGALSRGWVRGGAALSLLLWTAVTTAGRWIGLI